MENKRSFLLECLTQVFIKPRGILKMSQVWLPLGLILAAGVPMDPGVLLKKALLLLVAVLSKGLASILVNDLTDRDIDRRAGKERWITSIPLPAGTAIPVFLLVLGFLALLEAGGDLLVFASFAATILLGMLYSVKPVRFKERGIRGIFAYSLSAGILHAVVPWALFRPGFLLLPLLFFVVTADKLVQILFHQIADFESDRAEEVESFVVAAGREKGGRALRLVLKIAVIMDAVMFFTILFIIKENTFFLWLLGAAGLLGITASGLFVSTVSKKLGASTALTERLPWTYSGLSYVLFYVFPPLLFLMLSLHEPVVWVLAGLSALSFIGVSFNFFFYDPKK